MKYSLALAFLLGSELSYYLLILQTGITECCHSNLVTLFPMFIGGVFGTYLAGISWGRFNNPIHKIYIALFFQFIFSFFYPHFNAITLGILGIAVGMMAPLGIYLFKGAQQAKFLLALAIAYTTGTYFFTTEAETRQFMALVFTLIGLGSSVILRNYIPNISDNTKTSSFKYYVPLMFWIFLDSNLFETMSRHVGLNIWSTHTYTIITFHLIGLLTAYYVKLDLLRQHLLIFFLFVLSYTFSYLEMPMMLAIVYPFTISYYNVIVFSSLSKERSLKHLSYIMIFVGWIASGLGLGLALSRILH